ncbi:hypothetical protein Hamer_G011849, partial [Homarus americanus]
MLKRAHEICQLPFLVPTLHMQQIQNPNDPAYHKDSSRKAKNYLMLLTTADVIKYIHLLLDILHCLGRLSEQFEHRQTNVSTIMTEIQASVDILNKYLTSPGPSLRKILEGDITTFQGENLSDRNSTFMAARPDMLIFLITSLKKRFIDMASTVLHNSWILDFKLQPAEYTENEGFGDTAVGELAQTLEKTLREAEVVDLLLSIPTSSAMLNMASVRSSSSRHWCSHLTDDHLTDLLVVQLQSECVRNFNPEQAINRFLTTGAHRVDG